MKPHEPENRDKTRAKKKEENEGRLLGMWSEGHEEIPDEAPPHALDPR
jgi:hypothetical protein